jgi:hypothetical protein
MRSLPAASRRAAFALALAAAAVFGGCSSGPEVLMRFDRSVDFYAAPFPSEDLVGADGTIAIDGFPNRDNIDMVSQTKALIGRDARGFAQMGAVYFQLAGSLVGKHLPSLTDTTKKDSPIFLLSVDASASDYLVRRPLTVDFEADGGPFGTRNQLSLLPLQGMPLRPRTTYAAVVMKRLGDLNGAPLGASPSMASLARGVLPQGMSQAAFQKYRGALDGLKQAGVAAGDIAALAVFTTDEPRAGLAAVIADMLARPAPPIADFTLKAMYDSYCVYYSQLDMPVYQSGTPPYQVAGGDWVFTNGKPVVQHTETSRLVVTVPRTTIPDAGFPTVLYIRTGGGGEAPIADRGHEPVEGMGATPGTGPAQEFARVGFAGVQVDGPHGGLRNITNGDEQFLVFNFFNAAALRDNVRQSAAELVLMSHLLGNISVDTTACLGARAADGSARMHIDLSRLAIMGHSNGSWILPLVAASQPALRTALLSGAGGSFINNLVYKLKPLDVRSVAQAILSYTNTTLTEHDPVATLVQWGGEPADSQIYTGAMIREPAAGEKPRNVLMMQGIVDHYILPRIANPISLSLGLDQAGPELDQGNPGLGPEELPISQFLAISGRKHIDFPASGNIDAATTAVLVQHPEDGIEDGHEVVFQTEPPKTQYRCFLKTFAAGGAPTVIDGTNGTCP